MRDILTISGHALQQAVRRRVLHVVALLTLAFLGLFVLAASEAFDAMGQGGAFIPIDERALTGGTLLGLAMFVALFLGVVLAVFLTLDAVRGDAERGLLQPLVVRPIGRTAYLLGRFFAAAAVCAVYVVAVFLASVLIVDAIGGFSPSSLLAPAAGLGLGVATVTAISLLGSAALSSTANGIAIFMVFGTGLAAGLLGQIGEAFEVERLADASEIVAWVLPFEALYQNGLHALTSGIGGNTGVIVELGPFGGASSAAGGIWIWAVAWTALILAVAAFAFSRRDL